MARAPSGASRRRLHGCESAELDPSGRLSDPDVKGGRITDHWGGGKVYHWSRRWSAIMSAPSELGLRPGVSPRTA